MGGINMALTAAEKKELEELKARAEAAEAALQAAKAAESASTGVAPDNVEDAEAEAKKAYLAYMNEEVEVFIAKGQESKYQGDVVISVNNETISIKRGVKVKIKRYFAEALETSNKQTDYAIDIMSQLNGEYDEKFTLLN